MQYDTAYMEEGYPSSAPLLLFHCTLLKYLYNSNSIYVLFYRSSTVLSIFILFFIRFIWLILLFLEPLTRFFLPRPVYSLTFSVFLSLTQRIFNIQLRVQTAKTKANTSNNKKPAAPAHFPSAPFRQRNTVSPAAAAPAHTAANTALPGIRRTVA